MMRSIRIPMCCVHPSLRGILVLLVVLAFGCDRTVPADEEDSGSLDPSNLVKPVRVDTLHDNQAPLVGKVQSASISPRGSYLLSDRLGKLVHVFTADGQEDFHFGGYGSGPGEFESPGPSSYWGADTVAVVDIPNSSVQLFAEHGRRPLSRIFVGGFVISLTPMRSALVIGSVQLQTKSSVAILESGGSVVRYALPLSELMATSVVAPSFYGVAFVAARGDTLALAMMAEDRIRLVLGDSVFDSLEVPSARRRPPPSDLEGILKSGVARTPERLVLFSTLEGVVWLPDGRLAVWHRDWRFRNKRIPEWSRIEVDSRLRVFVSIASRKGETCADYEIDVSGLETPAITWKADTLLAVAHTTSPGASSVLTVRRYTFSDEECQRR